MSMQVAMCNALILFSETLWKQKQAALLPVFPHFALERIKKKACHCK